jgi:two-component system chemotaxis response regulator CheB
MVVIAASTGGPPALQTILAGLPGTFSAPLAIVQHISTGFIEGLRGWLQQTTGFPVHVASHREIPIPGHAYLAPDGSHLGFDASGRFLLSDVYESGLCPSASFLFRSAAAVFGASTLGVILTGMGTDGARELKLLKDRGAITFAQDKESSVVHGMPGEAIALGAATHILPPDRIAAALAKLAGESS